MGDSRPPGTPDDAQGAANQTDTPTPAALFGDRYRIERVIGEGAFGRVYLAFDTRLRRNVAVKELLASRHTTDRATYERYLERFQREARATGMIQQPNVVTVYDLHVDAAGNNYLVMEYVDGTNLRELLAQVGTLPVGRAVAVAQEMGRALEAVHEQDIVHRDVKPANIMITRRGTAKLMDFGIAQVGDESHRTQSSTGHPGTPIYMSPEQSTGYGYIDGRSDLYALGLVLYEMLVGEPYARKRQSLGAAKPELPPQLIAIVDKLMARDPDARYQTATDVLKDLDGLGTMTAPPAPDVYPLPDSAGSRPDAPPSVGWQTGAPVPGVPSAYGGVLSQPPAGAPAYATGAPPYATGVPPASATGTGGFAAPPAFGTTAPYVPPPSAPPPRRGNRGLLFGLGGAVLAIAVVAIIFIITRPGPTPTPATATVRGTVVAATSPTVAPTVSPTPQATTIASATPRPTASPTVGPTVTAPARATTPSTVTASGSLTTFTDPKSLIRLQYPSGWQATKVQDDPANALELDGPDNVFFWLYVYDPQQGTITDEINIISKNQDSSTDFTYANRAVTDVTIAGEPAKTMTYTFASNKDPASKGPGQWWVVNHNGKQFTFRSNYPGNHQRELDAIIASVAFSTNGAFMQLTTWTDPKGLVKLQYPNGWSVTKDAAIDSNVLELDGPDGTYFFLDIYNPQTGATVDAQIQDIRDVHAQSTKFTYQDGNVTDTRIGGEPGKTFPFAYTAKDKANAQAFNGQIWDVNHGGTEYLITGNASTAHQAEVNAIVASITFLK